MTTCNRVFLAMLAGCVLLPAVAGAQNKRRLAYTDPRKAGADYAYQGEFLGRFVENDRGRQIGLQVVAQGDGRFLGVEYTGGLPGSGWNRTDVFRTSGKLDQGYIYLSTPKHQFYVGPKEANVYDMDGELLGKIPKVHRVSPTLGNEPPENAVVLFAGKANDLLQKPRVTPDGLLMEGTQTRRAYKDFTLHLEFKLPYMPYARGQGRANSGVYLQSRYEVQILDSFGLKGVANECGGLYKQRPPAMNMCLPPLLWQTYDITLKSAEFDDSGRKAHNARITVRHNGVLIHNNIELTGKTGAGRKESPKSLPTKLQNHGNPVRFRNIWLVEHDGSQSTQVMLRRKN